MQKTSRLKRHVFLYLLRKQDMKVAQQSLLSMDLLLFHFHQQSHQSVCHTNFQGQKRCRRNLPRHYHFYRCHLYFHQHRCRHFVNNFGFCFLLRSYCPPPPNTVSGARELSFVEFILTSEFSIVEKSVPKSIGIQKITDNKTLLNFFISLLYTFILKTTNVFVIFYL